MKIVFDPERSGEINTNFVQQPIQHSNHSKAFGPFSSIRSRSIRSKSIRSKSIRFKSIHRSIEKHLIHSEAIENFEDVRLLLTSLYKLPSGSIAHACAMSGSRLVPHSTSHSMSHSISRQKAARAIAVRMIAVGATAASALLQFSASSVANWPH